METPMANRTDKQVERDRAKDSSGKFRKMNACEVCNKPVGNRYFSDDRCNVYAFGLMLCKKCCSRAEDMDDDKYLEFFGISDPVARALRILEKNLRRVLWKLKGG